MNILKALAGQKPVLFTLLLVTTCISALYSTLLINIDNALFQDIVSSLVKNLITIALLVMLVKLNWLKQSGLITPFSGWHSKWWLASLPFGFVALLNLTSIDFGLLSFNTINIIGWVYINLSTGMFEEIMLRGVCFVVLFSAWRHKENGLMKAAVCQALIFGLVHYVNLTKAPFLEVSVQVIYATLIGVGFAGLVAYCRSLWPAIALHFLINACGSISTTFQSNYVADERSMVNYAIIIFVIAVTTALPGYLLLKKSAKQLPTASLAAS